MLAVPYSVDLSLTNDCNMNCIHCNLSSGNPKIDEMSTSEVKNLIKELYNLGVFSIAITGGEPLLRKDCFEIIEFALSFNGLRVILNTNGTLFRKRQIRYIANNLKNLELAISMDGSNDREYNSLRMNKNNNNYSNFKIVLHNIEYFKFLDFNNISLNFVVSKRNIDFYKNVVLLAEKLKLKGVLAIKFFQHGRGKLYSDDLELDYTIWENFLISVLEDNKNCKS
ncbi:MAG: radical SAM protein [Tissierellales bacterium]|nr:radical SAM protein [Tissierellales bacterium]